MTFWKVVGATVVGSLMVSAVVGLVGLAYAAVKR